MQRCKGPFFSTLSTVPPFLCVTNQPLEAGGRKCTIDVVRWVRLHTKHTDRAIIIEYAALLPGAALQRKHGLKTKLFGA